MTTSQSPIASGMTRRGLLASAAAGAGTLALYGCTGSTGGSSSAKGTLTVAAQSDNLTQVFNPFLENTAQGLTYTSPGSGGFIYEPLVQINTVDIGNDLPWLAKSWRWSDGNKTLTLELHTGVKWTDGQPFSADDVVFTYMLLKQNAALNLGGVKFSTVTAPSPSQIVFTFDVPSEQFFTEVVSVPIVSKHIWSTVKNPVTYTDKNPVGTGPYKLSTFSAQSFTLVRNEDYWQPKAEITSLRFVAYKDNESMTNALVQGLADWGGTYIANADKTYLSRSKHNNYWAPLAGTDGIIPNLERWPLSDIAVRRAISLGVKRKQVGAATGSPPATSVTGLPMPAYTSSIAPQYKGVGFEEDPAKAEKTLTDAGYAKGSDGYYHKGGKRVEFSISFPSAYTDIASRVQVLVSQLKDIGIKLTIDTTTVNDINVITSKGEFDSTMGYPVNSAPRAFSYYYDTINPNLYFPIGKATPTYQNIERFQNAEAKQLFDEYPKATTDAQRQQILDGIEKIFVENLPWIPMFYWGSYGNWSTAKATGFPTPQNPYFSPVPNPVVALRLKPV
ncbi:peptide/nickel transport system substrate-binding protein [Actinacidiphila yanglinensis]|uniref:Peptide/nickel transport system substrate-binding protein n=1 Tax=Actinacidiphila yanglinensis TaxID=310779 RepID=A0A1H6E2T3_9ACTN|nr:ABC transporter substrate-binding protein [Actinacidiphila yanglinensis]SEG91609.1 peptide/nickel transport system substrate-binding protein [Actinacidiphila yanglinensis]